MKEKKKLNKGIKMIIGLLVLCGIITCVCMFFGGEKEIKTDYIGVLEISGTISVNDGATYDQQTMLESVKKMKENPYNQAMILHIDSPGGAVYQIDELYLALMDYKSATGRPIYAAIESYGASGGYYLACAADEIYANRNTITGSIGVIMGEFIDLSQLLDKAGIEVSFIASGANKAMGNNYEPLTDEQREIYQSIVNEYYDNFVNVIVSGRNLPEEQVRVIGDGRIYSASQALDCHLIDGIESYANTLERLKADYHLEECEVHYYYYEAPASLMDFLSQSNGKTLVEKLMAYLGIEKTTGLEAAQPPKVLMYCFG